MKKTKLYEMHKELNGKMVEFAGFLMPLNYKSSIEEHNAVRNNVGIFDVSHMGEFYLKGRDVINFLEKITCNLVKKIEDKQAQYNCLINDNGGVVDDIIIYRFDSENFMIVVNASNIEKDWKFIKSKIENFNIEIKDNSDEISLLAIQGKEATNFVYKVLEIENLNLKYYRFSKIEHKKYGTLIISNTGYTGAGGLEIFCQNEFIKELWNDFLNKGKEIGLTPCGLASRDSLRLEMGFCLYGNELNEETTPVESGLKKFISIEKEYNGSKIILKQINEGQKKKIVGIELIERGIPRKDQKILDLNKKEIGYITSGGFSPIINKGIALAFIDSNYHGSEILLETRDKFIKGEVKKFPFIKK